MSLTTVTTNVLKDASVTSLKLANNLSLSGTTTLVGDCLMNSLSTLSGFTIGAFGKSGLGAGIQFIPTGNGTLRFSRNSDGIIPISVDIGANKIAAGTFVGGSLNNSAATTYFYVSDADNTTAQRNGLNPQTLNIYNTYTSATSAERAKLGWVNNTFVIGTETLPTSASNRDMAFQIASSTRMTITSGGNIGIGTTTPSGALEISSTTSLLGSGITYPLVLTNVNGGNNNQGVGLWFNAINTSTKTGAIDNVRIGSSDYSMYMGPFGSLRALTLRSSGNVGVATTTPNEKLTVAGNVSATGNLTVGGSLFLKYTDTSTNYTVLSTDYTINCTSNSFRVQLPDCLLYPGIVYNIKNSGTGTITLSGFGSQTIDGNNSVSLNSRYMSLKVQSISSSWIIL